jgi:uncharacterized membrane protein YoaK (UPF0700 family)
MIDIKPQPMPRLVPPLLSFVAGYVDSCTFLGLFGVYIAQMTGSFVQAGTQVVAYEPGLPLKLAAIPTFFLGGVAATLLVAATGSRGRAALAATIALECVLLSGLFGAAVFGGPLRSIDAPAVLAAALLGVAAMGVQSAMVRLLMSGVASTNVMTTNTTLIAIDATLALLGRRAVQAQAARKRLAALLPITLGFILGTATGALGYAAVGFESLAAPIALAYGLLAWALFRRVAPLAKAGAPGESNP